MFSERFCPGGQSLRDVTSNLLSAVTFGEEHTRAIHRHLLRMQTRTRHFLALALLMLVIGITTFIFSRQNQEPVQQFPATINRDCAPWDGAAFTVSVPIAESTINISIYQSPDLRLPVTFSFPDETLRVGSALLIFPAGLPEQLRGRVYFQRVEEGKPVDGKFDLATDSGQQFRGMFKAEWETETVYCG